MTVTVNIECLLGQVGFIVPMPTGVLWQNQVGGRAVAYPALEGFFVPLPSDFAPNSACPLYAVTPQEYDPSLAAKFLLAHADLSRYFEATPVGATDQSISKAWVPLRVRGDLTDDGYGSDLFAAFRNMDVVLTYPNE